MTDFKIGDLVQLKAGGPSMVIERMEGTSVTCVWFELSGTKAMPKRTPKRFEFEAITLIPFKRHAMGIRVR